MLLSLGGLFLAAACVRDSLGDTCFSHTDGACRSSTMNNSLNMLPEGTFRLNDKHELEECEVACAERIDCVAIEWAAITDGHCEIWTVLPTHTEPDCGRLCDLTPVGCYEAQRVAPAVTAVGASTAGKCRLEGSDDENYNRLPEGSYRLNDVSSLDECVTRYALHEQRGSNAAARSPCSLPHACPPVL